MPELPTGTVTFLFTDIEGSTRLLHEHGERYSQLLLTHRRLLRNAFEQHGGVELDTEGDAFFVVFSSAREAVAAAAEAQAELAKGPIRVRMGLHTGEAQVVDGTYVGLDVHRAARIAAAGHGGQVLLSETTKALVVDAGFRDLGEHRLKDLLAPERLYQLGEGDFPPLKSLYRTSLPVPATAFLGRERELKEVTALLARDDVRLLTLTGPGGTGKTRLALQTAAEAAEDYPEGVFWVGLAPLRDPALVLPTIAQAVGGKEDLAEQIGSRNVLLLLDNLEQLLDCALDLAALLASCPNLKFLVTSRAPLRLSGEQEYPVTPLTESDGLLLFLERARAARPDFSGNGVVSRICERVDQLPLAIELAAARVRALMPQAILDRLDQRLPLLTGGSRDLPERQRTLRSTIAWSYELLTEEEQLLFARLSVFAGGSTLETAEEICQADLETLESLVEKSLVRQSANRFWMLETIREYGAERLHDSGQTQLIQRRHALWFLALAERTEDELRGPSLKTSLEKLDAEHPNLRAAFGWLLDHGHPDEALRLATALDRFFQVRGHITESRRWLALGLEHVQNPAPALKAKALCTLARLAFGQGDFEAARPLYEEGLSLYRGLNDLSGIARSLADLGWVELRTGRFDRAEELNAESIAAARRAGADWILSGALHNAALTASESGRQEEAIRLFEEALELRRRLRDDRAISITLLSLGWVVLLRGETDRAIRLLEESLALAKPLGDKQSIAWTLNNLGVAWLYRGDLERAEPLFTETLELCRELVDRHLATESLTGLAAVAASRADAKRFARLCGAAEALHEQMGTSMNSAEEWVRQRFADLAQSDEHADAHAAGRAMSFEEAVAYALGETDG